MEGQKSPKKQSAGIIVFRIILIIILFPVVITYLILTLKKKKRQNKQDKDRVNYFRKSQLETLSGIEFEEVLKSLFEKMGYKVLLTKTSGDFGADLIISKNGKNALIQAKRYNHTVGVRAVQEIIAAREHYKVFQAFVITNSSFSSEAEHLALESEVQLVDGDALEKMLIKYDVKIAKTLKKSAAMCDIAQKEITNKYRFWI